ncbi:hypothetical protein NAEGRDRAFT_64992 [Naegleria gruberi]|uniref:F-box domain-containing protein n=1 Tax=Naegleria gruberi TaxID=5762 RepID=D2V814_NAEGR|nr:uncharacterized protein NAEGRDRAFT_64992 [Naegleria gruberi]EFC46964.1 hypothetical protein NAEGRDRAFT_64992 [Naegleria gruberi]|eukprot:XP_002679708.1 hypothetical protein NAEGRDRAFT_64992 [Naegleria gruberi strain NEG-M]
MTLTNADTLPIVMTFLDVKSVILSCSLVSREWNHLTRLNSIWKLKYEQIFMESVFNWTKHVTNSSNDDDDSDSDSDSKDESSDNSSSSESEGRKRKKRKKIKKSKKQKTRKSNQEDYYWFNLFKKCILLFPILDIEYENVELLANQLDYNEIKKITNVQQLHEIIYHLKETIRNQENGQSQLTSDYQYKFHNSKALTLNKEMKANLMQLATILTVLYDGQSIFYFTDNVLIRVKKEMWQWAHEDEIDCFECTLPAFCMLVLYPKAEENIPLKKMKKKYHLMVSPSIENHKREEESDSESDNDDEKEGGRVLNTTNSCFWLDMMGYSEPEGKNDICFCNYFDWCPNFISSENSTNNSPTINTSMNTKKRTIQISKYE